jgi:hypothetical protein
MFSPAATLTPSTLFVAQMDIEPELAFWKRSRKLCMWSHHRLRVRKCPSTLGSNRRSQHVGNWMREWRRQGRLIRPIHSRTRLCGPPESDGGRQTRARTRSLATTTSQRPSLSLFLCTSVSSLQPNVHILAAQSLPELWPSIIHTSPSVERDFGASTAVR